MQELPLSTSPPRKGPLVIENAPDAASEVVSRSRARERAFLELSMLDADRRPLRDPYKMLAYVICMMARNDSPLAALARWLVELFEIVNPAVSLKMRANKWTLAAPPDVDHDCQNYVSASAQNIGDEY